MNQATHAVASQPSNDVPHLARQARIGAAIASAIVTCALFGSVVLGMAPTAENAGQIVARSLQATRT